MGTIFRLPVIESEDLVATLGDLHKKFGIEVIAAHPRSSQPLDSVSILSQDCCIVLGSEGSGISEEVLAACTQRVAIPMVVGVDSLNVSSASAVFLFEVNRQRKG